MPIERRSVFVLLVLGTPLLFAVAAGCSDSNPAKSEGGGGTQLVPVDGGDGGPPFTFADAGIPDADIDSAQFVGTPCLGDTSETIDGSAGPTACASIASCSALCGRITTRFKLGVAQVAIHCLTQLGTCADSVATANCVEQAFGRACADTTAPGYCSPLVTACDPNAGGAGSNISENDCEGVASSLTSSGRTQLSACIRDKISAGTCTSEVLDCMNDLHE